MAEVVTERGSGHDLAQNDPSPSDLSPRQINLIAALLAGDDITSASASVGIGRKTAHRYLSQPAFQAALKAAETEVMAATTRQLVRLGGRAVRVLEGVLDDPGAPEAVRVRASDIVLTKLLALRESIDLEARISAIEQALAEREENTHGQKY